MNNLKKFFASPGPGGSELPEGVPERKQVAFFVSETRTERDLRDSGLGKEDGEGNLLRSPEQGSPQGPGEAPREEQQPAVLGGGR